MTARRMGGRDEPTKTRPAQIPASRTPAHERLLLTVEEAGAVLGIGRSLMYELIASGEITTVRVGRLRRIRPEALRSYVAALDG